MRTHRWTALLGAILLLVLLAACSSRGPAPEFPYGSYRSNGSRHITITEDGTWSFALAAGPPLVTGDVVVEGWEITFGDETQAEGQNVPTCAEHHTYTWSFEDDTLTFEPKGDDPCGHRAGDLHADFFPDE